MISFIIPTRDRPEQLAVTLSKIGALPRAELERAGGAEVIVADNASRFVTTVPERLGNGVVVELLLMARNEGAASRNAAARAARGDWLVMLDDDSHPLDAGFVRVLENAATDVGAVGAEILLHDGARGTGWNPRPDGRGSVRVTRESGGLPEVFIGCGVAIRRSVFLDDSLGGADLAGMNGAGYDPSFHYYAEEYDLAARMILGGWRVVHDRGFRVEHRKVRGGRDMNTILRRLVRNNAWVEQRYAPESERRSAIQRVVSRYRAIAEKERAVEGYALGLGDLDDTLDAQPRAEMTTEQYDRFTGLHAARLHLGAALRQRGVRRAATVEPGKNLWVVERVLAECGVEVVAEVEQAEAVVIGTMSPGPMLDAGERWGGERTLLAWEPKRSVTEMLGVQRLTAA